MSQVTPLNSVFWVRARFSRSVNISADYRDPGALTDYIVTPLSRAVLRRIAEGLKPGSRTRAWSITGPYGAGKSACALFAAKVLGYPVNAEARELLRASDSDLYGELRDQVPGLAEGGFFFVLSVGSRQPLSLAVVQGLIQALSAWQIQDSEVAELRSDLERAKESADRGEALSPDAVTNAVKRTARVVCSGNDRALGLLLIVDELGKLLEYAAHNPTHSDIFLLQSLAEVADRSGDSPIGLIVILHQAFERYADRLSPRERQEWRKVQGRFEDIGFLESQGELLRLIGAAMVPLEPPSGLVKVIASEVAQLSKVGISPRDLGFGQLEETLRQCAPLHPTVALILSRLFRSRLAQGERSLFAFLTSGEPYGLQDYLKREVWKGDGYRPFYRIDLLYDYVVSAMGSALYVHAQGKKWAEIDNALERLPANSSPVEVRLVKAIGLLGLLGDQRQLRASKEVLICALADGSATTEGDVRNAIDRLRDLGIAIYRRHKEAYGLWEGSDIDLDERFQKGLDQIDRSGSLAALVEAYGQLKPYVAKRHLHETGTLRHFAPWVTDLAALDDVLQRPLGDADGAIVFVLANHGAQPAETLDAVREKASQLNFPRRGIMLIAVPKDTSGLREALEEVQAWEWVVNNTPELEGDSIARKELAGRQLDARGRLNYLCSQSFDKASSYAACVWLWRGKVRTFASARALSAALSDACDVAYNCAPKVHNELVNRRTLSSAAAAARRTLIERRLDHPSRHRFYAGKWLDMWCPFRIIRAEYGVCGMGHG